MRSDEVAYYRAVEDHFARLRGTLFLFTPMDFALLRQWWGDGVPLAAVIAGSEAFDFLDAPIRRLAGKNVPIPYNRTLERAAVPQVEDIVSAARALAQEGR